MLYIHVHTQTAQTAQSPTHQTKELVHTQPHHTQIEAAALQRVLDALEANIPARRVPLNDEELELVKGLCLLTMKPMIYAANVEEGDLADQVAWWDGCN